MEEAGEVCDDIKTTKTINVKNINPGDYKYFTCSIEVKTNNSFDYTGNYLIQGSRGSIKNCIHYTKNEKFSLSPNMFLSKQKENSNINLIYIYYYIKIENEKIFNDNFIKGAGPPMINKDMYYDINIPIPSIETQNQVVQILDDLAEQKLLLSDRKSGIDRQMKYYFETQIKKHLDNITFEPLENITDMSIKGDTNSKDASNTGEYPFYKASVSNPQGTHKTYCFDGLEYILFVKSGGNAKNPLSLSHGIGKCYLVNGKSSGNSEVMRIVNNTKYDYLTTKYLYYYLKFNQLNIQKLAKYSTNLGHIDIGKLKKFNIIIFKEEKQTEIVEYLDKLEAKKNSIDEEINDIDNLMKQVLEQSYN